MNNSKSECSKASDGMNNSKSECSKASAGMNNSKSECSKASAVVCAAIFHELQYFSCLALGLTLKVKNV